MKNDERDTPSLSPLENRWLTAEEAAAYIGTRAIACPTSWTTWPLRWCQTPARRGPFAFPTPPSIRR